MSNGNPRSLEIAGFLARCGWAEARLTAIPADFSPRRYARLEKDSGVRAILMDADEGQKTDAFVAVDGLLRGAGFSAPEIYAAEPSRGFVLMEDFGDRNIGRLIDGVEDARPYLKRGVEVLARLHEAFTRMEHAASLAANGLPLYDAERFAAQAELFLDAYIPFAARREVTGSERDDFRAAWRQALDGIDVLPKSLMLRDFMPDNLMDLPGREGVKGTGLLDFQDAGIGPIAYDLASLCEEARRDGGGLLDEMVGYYCEIASPAVPKDTLLSAARTLSLQRHMRILGILARLAGQGRREKIDLIPRVERWVTRLVWDDARFKPLQTWSKRGTA